MEKMGKGRKICVFLFLIIVPALIFSFKKKEKSTEKEIYSQNPFAFSRTWQDLPEFIFVNENSLKSYLPPAFISGKVLGTMVEMPEQKKEIQEYVVKEGDTLSSIAEKFGISLETILWANDLSKNSVIKPGQKLVILPVSGVLHNVKSGDTLSEIAKKYQAKIEDIVSFNELENENDIYIGDILIIPGGKMPSPKPVSQPLAPLAQGYFICPVAGGCRITQGLHWYNAIDFSNGKCGEPILAAAGGIVLKVRYGWNGGAGNYVKILHPNGVVTMYGHLQAIFVSPGEEVFQGQIIGTMGAAGRATGCHLHFGVYGAKNPFAK
jgi:murein DD-endopeptidase MepM/ murein hydrolase activator NlpD